MNNEIEARPFMIHKSQILYIIDKTYTSPVIARILRKDHIWYLIVIQILWSTILMKNPKTFFFSSKKE